MNSFMKNSKVKCILCDYAVSSKQSKTEYPRCRRCHNCSSSRGYLFRQILYLSNYNSSDFKRNLLYLFCHELLKENWFCGKPGRSAKALYFSMWYKYTELESDDLLLIESSRLKMKMSIDKWRKTCI
jgi:hypothetical protein